MTYWTSWIAYILILGGISETLNVLKQKPTPYAALLALPVILGVAYLLIKYGIKKQKSKNKDGLL